MAQRFWSGTIGGLALEEEDSNPCGFELTGAGAFLKGDWTSNTRPGLLGNPQTQYSQIIGNRVLEIHFLHAPAALFQSLIDLLIALIPGGGNVVCTFQDGFQTITGHFKPSDNWLDRGEPDGDYLIDAIIRLIQVVV